MENNPLKLRNRNWELEASLMADHNLHDETTLHPLIWPSFYNLQNPPQLPTSSPCPSSLAPVAHEEVNEDDPEEDLGPMKEMMFKIASMQPVDIDLATIHKPKRRNVRISEDPQSVAARHRREKISEKMRILQRLVPGGTKMDTASMLDEAVLYVKFLRRQIRQLQAPPEQPPPPISDVVPDWPAATAKAAGLATADAASSLAETRGYGGFGRGDEAGDSLCFNRRR